ncbi:MAG: InlB B-repeat-containing protein, partial [Actinomycetia bacterium]|nr:InlB B-repeat-containing protein [Actinomycetes bacterium]
TDTTVLVTAGDEGGSGDGDSFRPSISEDGTWVSFTSYAHNLKGATSSAQFCNIYLWNAETGDCKLISVNPDKTYADGFSDYSSINADGTHIAYESDANTLSLTSLSDNYYNVFLWDAEADDSILISARPDGTQADSDSYEPSISADGNKIAFQSFATDLIADLTLSTPEWNSNIYVWDASAPTKLITAGTSGTGGNTGSWLPSISGDGTKVAYLSEATNLGGVVPTNGWENAFIAEIDSLETKLISAGASGSGANGNTDWPSTSYDGSFVSFVSWATDQIGAPTSLDDWHVFLCDVATLDCTLITAGPNGTGANADSEINSISYDGTKVAFDSAASNLVGAPTANTETWDTFLWQRATTVTVTFDGQNGTPLLTVDVPQGTPVTEPIPPTKAGYTFDGWWTEPVGGSEWMFDTPILADMTLYAHWIANDQPVPPEPVKPDVPPTGDSFGFMSVLTLLAPAGLVFVSAGLSKKRSK